MPTRIDKINSHIQRTFGEILHREADMPPDVLVTISHVETRKNVRSSVIWIYVTPSEKEEEVMQILSDQMYALQGSFNRAVNIHPLPRITLKIDHGLHHAQNIEQKLNDLT